MPNQPQYPQYQSFNCLTEIEANVLTNNYINYIESQGQANLASLFRNESEYLKGYSVTLSDYTAMISFPGVAVWKLRFAYQQGAQGNMLQFVVVGCTAGGTVMTPYFQLKNRITGNLSGFPSLPSMDKVPRELEGQWGNAYLNLIAGGIIPPALLQSPWYSGNTLKGYNFNFSDFLDILYNQSEGVVLPGTSTIELRVMNHAEYRENNQSAAPGMIGVAITAVSPGATSSAEVLTFYDISAPCPPTCP